MSSRAPYILLTFANPLRVPQHYLKFLTQESSKVYGHLEAYDVEDRCGINRIPNATVEDVFNALENWHRRKDLVLFHYGGHASGARLLLSDVQANNQEVSAEGLARLLGSIPSLQLVFLNGCSTKAQVQLLFTYGVKAMIATAKPIQDNMRWI